MLQGLFIRVLGPVVIEDGTGKSAKVQGKKLSSLVVALTVAPDRKRDRNALAADLWPDCSAQEARRNLRQAIFALKSVVEPIDPTWLMSDDDSVWFAQCSTSDWDMLQSAKVGNDACAWSNVIEQYRGPTLRDSTEPWCVQIRHETESAFLEVLFRAIGESNRQGKPSHALSLARKAIEVDPYSERAAFAVVRLLVGAGQLKQAKDEYNTFKDRLWKALRKTPTKTFEQLPAAPSQVERLADPHVQAGPAVSRLRKYAVAIGCVTLVTAMGSLFGSPRAPTSQALMSEFEDLASPQGGNFDTGRLAVVLSSLGELAFDDCYHQEESRWVGEFKGKWDVMIETVEWCRKHRPDLAMKISGSLSRYASLSGNEQEWGWLMRSILRDPPKCDPGDLARCQVAFSFNNFVASAFSGDVETNVSQACSYYEKVGDTWGLAQATRGKGFCLSTHSRWPEALQYYSLATPLYRRAGRPEGMALNSLCSGIAELRDAPDKVAEQERRINCLIDSVDSWVQTGNEWGIKFSTGCLCLSLRNYSGPGSSAGVMWAARERFERLLRLEAFRSDKGAEVQVLLADAQLSIHLGDRKGIANALYWAGSGTNPLQLSNLDRYRMFLAARNFDPASFEERGGRNWLHDLRQLTLRDNPRVASEALVASERVRAENLYPLFFR